MFRTMFPRRTTRRWFRQAVCCGVGVVVILFGGSAQGAAGTWNVPGGGGWDDPANWLGSIPNGPGDVALFDVLQPTEDATIQLRSPITVGTIEQANPNRLDIWRVGDPHPLLLAAAGSGGVVRIRLADGAGDLAIEAPVTLADDDLIASVVPGDSWLELPQFTSSGSSNLTKDGAGGLTLGGNNPTWTGLITVDEGTLQVRTNTALGAGSGTDADATTVQAAGTLAIKSGRTIAGEKIRLAGGTLASGTLGGDTAGTTTIGGPIELLADSVLTNLGPDGRLKLTGAVSGPGGALVGQGTVDLWGPLSFAGPLRVEGGTAKVRVASTHGGSEVGPGGRLLVTRIGSLVGAGQTTVRAGGELRVVKPAGDDPAASSVAPGSVLLDGGMLILANGDFDPANLLAPASTGGVLALENVPVFTAGGSNLVDFEAIGGTGVRLGTMAESTIPAAVTLVPDAATRTLRFGGAEGTLTIESVLADTAGGPTHLAQHQGGTTILAGANTYTGTTTVSDGTIVVEHAGALGSASENTVLNGGVVRINRPMSEPFLLQAGILETTQPYLGLSGSLTVSHLNSGVDVNVFAGELAIDDSETGRAGTNGDIVLRRQSEAMIVLPSDTVTGADIYLNSGTGFGFGGALRGTRGSEESGSAVLTGNLYLGDDGAYLGGDAQFRVEGRIYGGDLILGRRASARTVLAIVRDDQPYTGKTMIHGGEIVLAEDGRLSRTSGIDVFSGGRLYIDHTVSDGAVSDRVADTLPITMYGGEISSWPTEWGATARERIGHVTLARGISYLRGTKFHDRGDREATADLVVGEVERLAGSLLSVGTVQTRFIPGLSSVGQVQANSLFLENPPPVVNGMLPAWFLIDKRVFATYGPDGVVPNEPVQIPLASATPTSNVAFLGTETLTADATMNSLVMVNDSSAVDLGGHALTLRS